MKKHLSAIIAAVIPFAFCAAAGASPPYLFNAFPHLSFSRPVDLQSPPDGTNRLFVVQQTGEVYVVDNDTSATSAALFLDLADSISFGGEAGLLGLAFHPQYDTNRRFYISYVSAGPPMRQLLVEYLSAPSNPDSAVLSSHRIVLESPSTTQFHNAGQIAFDSGGYLLYTIGEDLLADEAQDRTNLLGSIVRIDVDNPDPGLEYGIPVDNPWADNPHGYREEIFAYGFRNPWRFTLPEAGTGQDPDLGKRGLV